jgi:hypothetical protein
VDPPIAAGQAGGSGAGGGFGAGSGSLDPDPPEEPPDEEEPPLDEPPDDELSPLEPFDELAPEPLDSGGVPTATGFCAECSVSLSRDSPSAASSLWSFAERSTISMMRMLDSSVERPASMPEITGELLAAPA